MADISKYWAMNITDEIKVAAVERGLEMTATGGGCDFVIREFGKGDERLDMVLSSADGPDSPDTMDEGSFVSVNVGEGWFGVISIGFPTAEKAMDFMASANMLHFDRDQVRYSLEDEAAGLL